MDSACPKELATQILSDSDHSTKVAPTTLRDFSTSELSQSKKYHPSKNLKFSILGIFQSFKLRIFTEKSFQLFLS